MARFRKKPVEVEAIQWTGDNLDEVTEFTGGKFKALPSEPHPPHLEHLPPPPITAQVYDELHATWVGVKTGQWVIRGVKGEFYPCDADVLASTYDPADEDRPATAAVIEIVEKTRTAEDTGGVIIPNEIRINGTPLLIAEDGIKVHEMNVPADELVTVTLTLLARRVTIAAEGDL